MSQKRLTAREAIIRYFKQSPNVVVSADNIHEDLGFSVRYIRQCMQGIISQGLLPQLERREDPERWVYRGPSLDEEEEARGEANKVVARALDAVTKQLTEKPNSEIFVLVARSKEGHPILRDASGQAYKAYMIN